MGNPLISVIVPIYNVEKYLPRCVDSLLNQTYDNYEILLVDDGSPDKCPEMIDKLASQHNCIKAFHKKNGGLGDARNYGIQRANGEWIVVVDSDDYVEPGYLLDLWDLKNELQSEMAMAWSIQVDEDDNLIGQKLHFDRFKASGADAIWEIYADNHVGWSAYNKLYPKWVLLENPFPTGYYEDMACMYKIVDAVESIAVGDFNDNYKYVQHTNGSILNSKLSEKHMHAFEICKEFGDFIDENYPSLNVLKSLIYVYCTVQMLHRQKMDDDDFHKVFLLNRKKIRESMKEIILTKRIPRKYKIYTILLSTEPWIYKKFLTMIQKRKARRAITRYAN